MESQTTGLRQHLASWHGWTIYSWFACAPCFRSHLRLSPCRRRGAASVQGASRPPEPGELEACHQHGNEGTRPDRWSQKKTGCPSLHDPTMTKSQSPNPSKACSLLTPVTPGPESPILTKCPTSPPTLLVAHCCPLHDLPHSFLRKSSSMGRTYFHPPSRMQRATSWGHGCKIRKGSLTRKYEEREGVA